MGVFSPGCALVTRGCTPCSGDDTWLLLTVRWTRGWESSLWCILLNSTAMPVRGCNYEATDRNYSLCLHSFQTRTLPLAEAHSSSPLVYLSSMIAVDIALEVLKAGFRVRGTVRSA